MADSQQAYSVGTANQLRSGGRFRHEYDRVGNLIKQVDQVTGQTRTYEFDWLNRVIGVQDWSSDPELQNSDSSIIQSVEYVYDSLGNRTARSLTLNGDTETESFTFNGNNVWLKSSSSGAIEYFLFGPGIDNVVASQRDHRVTFHLGDSTNTRDEVVASSVETYHVAYSAFGQIVGTTESNDSIFRFTSREYDYSTQEYYFRSRTYHPRVGRFGQADTIGFDGLDVNLYRYVFNDPTGGTDPHGTTGFLNDPSLFLTHPLIVGLGRASVLLLAGETVAYLCAEVTGQEFTNVAATLPVIAFPFVLVAKSISRGLFGVVPITAIATCVFQLGDPPSAE